MVGLVGDCDGSNGQILQSPRFGQISGAKKVPSSLSWPALGKNLCYFGKDLQNVRQFGKDLAFFPELSKC